MKIVEINIFLFGKPAWEIENFEGNNLEKNFSFTLKALGDKLKERLYKIAEIHEKLIDNGWEATGGLYTIKYTKNTTKKEAEKELEKLGIINHIDQIEERELKETEKDQTH